MTNSIISLYNIIIMKDTIDIIINVVILAAVCLVGMTMLVLFISSWRNINEWTVSDIEGDERDLEKNIFGISQPKEEEGNIFGINQHKKIE